MNAQEQAIVTGAIPNHPASAPCANAPTELAGALILAPLSGETGEQLRARPALQEYFEAMGFHGESAR